MIFEAFGRSQERVSPYAYIPNNSFAVSFSTFINDTNAISLLYDNGFKSAFLPIDDLVLDLATGTSGTGGEFLHAHIDLVLGGPTPNVTVTLTNGVTAATVTPYSNFDLSGGSGLGPYEGRVAFSAQCGDACAAFDVDNVVVQYLDPVTPVPSFSPAAILALAALLSLGHRGAIAGQQDASDMAQGLAGMFVSASR